MKWLGRAKDMSFALVIAGFLGCFAALLIHYPEGYRISFEIVVVSWVVYGISIFLIWMEA